MHLPKQVKHDQNIRFVADSSCGLFRSFHFMLPQTKKSTLKYSQNQQQNAFQWWIQAASRLHTLSDRV